MAAYSIVTHPVKDFATWRKVFDEFEPTRKSGGERSAIVLQGADDANGVTVINAWDSVDAVKAFFFGLSELKAAMEEAGVAGEPTFLFTREA